MDKKDLNKLTKVKLIKKLNDNNESLLNLRFQKQLQQLENPQSIMFLKREIAQIKTVLREMDLGIREERYICYLENSLKELYWSLQWIKLL